MKEDLLWITRAKRLVEYHEEATDFVNRVLKKLPSGSSDALAVGELWLEADRLDPLICALLNEMNEALLEGRAELNTTRGASMRLAGFEEEALFYECSWTLEWAENRGVMVNLAIEPSAKFYSANVHAMLAEQPEMIQHPIHESELKEALINAYVIEATYVNSAD